VDPALIDALNSRDLERAQRFIEDEDDPARVLAMYDGAIRHLYWSSKDIASVVLLGRAALAFGSDLENANHLGLMKSIAYDLGSFCWPGWDEPDIAIPNDVRDFGAHAANMNLELADRLDKDAGPKAHAHWLVGAHHLAAGRTESAVKSFETCATFAHMAEDRATELLASAYARIARREPLALEPFAAVEHGDELVRQLITAERVLGDA
jgi:hypothetical protein